MVHDIYTESIHVSESLGVEEQTLMPRKLTPRMFLSSRLLALIHVTQRADCAQAH